MMDDGAVMNLCAAAGRSSWMSCKAENEGENTWYRRNRPAAIQFPVVPLRDGSSMTNDIVYDISFSTRSQPIRNL